MLSQCTCYAVFTVLFPKWKFCVVTLYKTDLNFPLPSIKEPKIFTMIPQPFKVRLKSGSVTSHYSLVFISNDVFPLTLPSSRFLLTHYTLTLDTDLLSFLYTVMIFSPCWPLHNLAPLHEIFLYKFCTFHCQFLGILRVSIYITFSQPKATQSEQ